MSRPSKNSRCQSGRSESVTAAWIKFAEFDIQLLSQRYTHIAKNIYRYESETGFSAEIVVDDLGYASRWVGTDRRLQRLLSAGNGFNPADISFRVATR